MNQGKVEAEHTDQTGHDAADCRGDLEEVSDRLWVKELVLEVRHPLIHTMPDSRLLKSEVHDNSRGLYVG